MERRRACCNGPRKKHHKGHTANTTNNAHAGIITVLSRPNVTPRDANHLGGINISTVGAAMPSSRNSNPPKPNCVLAEVERAGASALK